MQLQKKIHSHPMVGHWKFLGRGWVLKAKILGAKYEVKLEFPGGEQNRNFPRESMDIFWNCTLDKWKENHVGRDINYTSHTEHAQKKLWKEDKTLSSACHTLAERAEQTILRGD